MTVKFLIMKEGRRTVEEAKAFARYREIDKDIKRDALKVFEAIWDQSQKYVSRHIS